MLTYHRATVEMSREESKSDISKRGSPRSRSVSEEEASNAVGNTLAQEWKRAQML